MTTATVTTRTQPRRRMLRIPQSLRTPLGITGLAIVTFWVLVAIFAPLLAPADPLGLAYPRLQPPNGENWLGTDAVGRDVLSRLIYGTRTALFVSVAIVACSMLIGSILGAVAGYFGRAVDEVIMRLADLVFAFPTIILAMVIAAALGPSLTNAFVALLLVSWPAYARVTRSLVIVARQTDYVVAGRLLGAGPVASLRRDIAPNVASPILILAMLSMGTAILDVSALSFLGLGVIPPTPDWGAMISDGLKNFSAWWISLFAGIAIFSAVVAFNLLGDSLRDALDPHVTKIVEDASL